MHYPSLFERLSILPSILPDNHAAGTINGTSCARGRARVGLVHLNVNDVPSGSTVDVTIQGQDPDAGTWAAVKGHTGLAGTNVTFAQRTSSVEGNLVGQLYYCELPFENYRASAVVVGASGAKFAVTFVNGDFPEYAFESAPANAFGAITGPAARAAATTP